MHVIKKYYYICQNNLKTNTMKNWRDYMPDQQSDDDYNELDSEEQQDELDDYNQSKEDEAMED